jgi:hypothetical protein
MVVVFGWGDGRSKDLGEVAPTTCPNCHNDVYLHEVQSEKQFSLYFIPLGSYQRNHYMLCPICQFGVPLSAENLDAVSRMRAATAVYRRGKVDAAYYMKTVTQFWAQVGRGPNGTQVLDAPETGARPERAAAQPAQVASPNLAQQLRELSRLREEGVLDEAEFAAAKRRLINF